jgi:hypothetical protein
VAGMNLNYDYVFEAKADQLLKLIFLSPLNWQISFY